MAWFEIYAKGKKLADVYDEQEIIKTCCELVNGEGISPDDIEVKEGGKHEH